MPAAALGLQHEVRSGGAAGLGLNHGVRSGSKTALSTGHNVHQPTQYRIFAIDTTSSIETELGVIDATAVPLELTGITLDDGVYDIKIRLEGWIWDCGDMLTLFRITVASGSISATIPPPIFNLTGTQRDIYLLLRWEWLTTFGTTTPDEFGVWFSTVGPPDTSTTPTATVKTSGGVPGTFEFTIEQNTDDLYIAVAARAAGVNGPVSTGFFTPALTPDEITDEIARDRKIE